MNSVKDLIEDTGSEFNGEWLFSSFDGVSNSESGCVLIALNVGRVSIELDDFTDQLVISDLDQLVHLRACHSFCDDQGSRHFEDLTE